MFRCNIGVVAGIGVLAVTLYMAGCAVEPQQPTRKSTTPATAPSSPAVPSKPQGNIPATPKVYSGPYPDRIEAALRDTLTGMPVRIARNGDTVKLIVPGSVAFAVNSEQLQPRFLTVLDNVAQLCREYSKTMVDIKGYTDSTGSFEHNQQLSEHRAQSVGNYLINRQVTAARIHTAGYGPRYPIADNRTDSGRAQNRRVEIELVPTP
ncbi:MAG TPA: OmpA family protein [Spongiibacteraceae bacterium]|jgi:outer membrane protein OmpA-like peptidoglycan-associated protein